VNAQQDPIETQPATVQETATVGSAVATVQATDADSDPLSYSLVTDGGGRFQIDSQTGVVSLAQGLDFEDVASFDLLVRVTDTAQLTDDLTLAVTVGDQNDETPVFLTAATNGEPTTEYELGVTGRPLTRRPGFRGVSRSELGTTIPIRVGTASRSPATRSGFGRSSSRHRGRPVTPV